MDRRDFLRLIAGSSIALAVEPLAKLAGLPQRMIPAGATISFDILDVTGDEAAMVSAAKMPGTFVCRIDDDGSYTVTFEGLKRFRYSPRNADSEPALTVQPNYSSLFSIQWKY